MEDWIGNPASYSLDRTIAAARRSSRISWFGREARWIARRLRSVPTIIAGLNSTNAVTLNTASGLNRGSASVSYFAQNQPDARVADWNFTVEKEIMPNTVVRVGYIGNPVEQYGYKYLIEDCTAGTCYPGYLWSTDTSLRTGSTVLTLTATQMESWAFRRITNRR